MMREFAKSQPAADMPDDADNGLDRGEVADTIAKHCGERNRGGRKKKQCHNWGVRINSKELKQRNQNHDRQYDPRRKDAQHYN